MSLKFYYCKHCGKIIAVTNEIDTPTICCGETMSELVPCVTDGAAEKHVPVFETDGNIVTVKIGEESHPMKKDHYIQWILLQTNKGVYAKYLLPEAKPKATFIIECSEKVVAAYEYCNIHKLWKGKPCC